jgi:hypothetical protein
MNGSLSELKTIICAGMDKFDLNYQISPNGQTYDGRGSIKETLEKDPFTGEEVVCLHVVQDKKLVLLKKKNVLLQTFQYIEPDMYRIVTHGKDKWDIRLKTVSQITIRDAIMNGQLADWIKPYPADK